MDALEKLKDIITDDIYNDIEESFEEKDSRISELESEKEDLEYEVSNLESEISAPNRCRIRNCINSRCLRKCRCPKIVILISNAA